MAGLCVVLLLYLVLTTLALATWAQLSDGFEQDQTTGIACAVSFFHLLYCVERKIASCICVLCEGAVGTFWLLLIVLRCSLSKLVRCAGTVAPCSCDNSDGSCQETPICFGHYQGNNLEREAFSLFLSLLLR